MVWRHGGEVYEETLKLFRAFKPYKLEDYRFRDAYSGAVRTGGEDVYGALYSKPGEALVVISNTSREPRKNIVFTVKPELAGFPSGRVSVKNAVTGQEQTIDAAGLADGSLRTELNGYEYRIFEVRPKP